MALAFVPVAASVPVGAQETITYTYDALGRLVKVDHGATGPNANLVASYTYDSADNRCNVTVSTTGAGGTGICTSADGTTALTLSPTTLIAGTVAAAYGKTITAVGGSGSGYTFAMSAGALPTGLTLSSAGVLSGTPTTAAIYRFTVTATDTANNTGSQSYNITVNPANDLTLSPTTLPGGTVGTAYSKAITTTGGTSPYTFTKSTGALPAGLTLSSGGVLSGTPTNAATYSFTIKATDSTGNHIGTRSYSITVNPASTLTLSPTTLPGGTVGTAYSKTITATGGISPYTFTRSAGTLPAGLTLSSAGLLSGTPTTAATYSFTIKATDSGGDHIGTRAYSVAIAGNVNHPPVANDDIANTTVCQTIDILPLANDTDPDGDALSLVSVSGNGFTLLSSTLVQYEAPLSPGGYSGSYVV